MTGDTVGPGKLTYETQQTAVISLDRGIVFGVRTFKITVRNNARPAMAGPDDVHEVGCVFGDQAIQGNIKQVQAWCRPQ